jgi:hypothetical protein
MVNCGPGPEQAPEVDIPGQRHAHEVGHDTARRQQPERTLAVVDQVAQPAHDLLLDEGRQRAGMPDVDALVGHLGQQLAHHRDRQRRWCEVPELAGVLRVHLTASKPIVELVEDRRDRGGGHGRARRTARRPKELRPKRGVWRRIAHRPVRRLVVQEVERRRPGIRPEPLHRGARGSRVSVRDQLGFRVPGKALTRVRHGPRW